MEKPPTNLIHWEPTPTGDSESTTNADVVEASSGATVRQLALGQLANRRSSSCSSIWVSVDDQKAAESGKAEGEEEIERERLDGQQTIKK